jgi:hypothetical protein
LYGGVVQQIVAVKTLLPGSSIKAKSDFLTEAVSFVKVNKTAAYYCYVVCTIFTQIDNYFHF